MHIKNISFFLLLLTSNHIITMQKEQNEPDQNDFITLAKIIEAQHQKDEFSYFIQQPHDFLFSLNQQKEFDSNKPQNDTFIQKN